jgi:hypothetical protein
VQFHPTHCNLLSFSSSRGAIKVRVALYSVLCVPSACGLLWSLSVLLYTPNATAFSELYIRAVCVILLLRICSCKLAQRCALPCTCLNHPPLSSPSPTAVLPTPTGVRHAHVRRVPRICAHLPGDPAGRRQRQQVLHRRHSQLHLRRHVRVSCCSFLAYFALVVAAR